MDQSPTRSVRALCKITLVDDVTHTVDVEPTTFQKKLATYFRRHPNTEEVDTHYIIRLCDFIHCYIGRRGIY